MSSRSRWALNGANFFLAEMVGVNLPFLAAYLKQENWSYSGIGMATAAAGLGTLLFQALAGTLSDRIQNRRALLAAMSFALGICFALLPAFTSRPAILDALLFLSGIAGAFFVPLLATLALSLVGAIGFDRFFGTNQSFNHAGNIFSALLAYGVVKWFGIVAIFYLTGIVSVLASVAILFIKSDDLRVTREKTMRTADIFARAKTLLSEPKIAFLLLAVALFHLANAPAMPLVAMYLKKLGGNDSAVASVVLVAQLVMIPISFLAGRYAGRFGRKKVFAVAFLALPLRLFLYLISKDPNVILAVQALDGIGAGIYGVVIALICSDLTHGKGGFNFLLGVAQTALALGGFIGPLAQGFLTENLGFAATFATLGAVAVAAALIFILFVPETKTAESH